MSTIKPVTFETLIADQKMRIENNNIDDKNEVVNFIREINQEE